MCLTSSCSRLKRWISLIILIQSIITIAYISVTQIVSHSDTVIAPRDPYDATNKVVAHARLAFLQNETTVEATRPSKSTSFKRTRKSERLASPGMTQTRSQSLLYVPDTERSAKQRTNVDNLFDQVGLHRTRLQSQIPATVPPRIPVDGPRAPHHYRTISAMNATSGRGNGRSRARDPSERTDPEQSRRRYHRNRHDNALKHSDRSDRKHAGRSSRQEKTFTTQNIPKTLDEKKTIKSNYRDHRNRSTTTQPPPTKKSLPSTRAYKFTSNIARWRKTTLRPNSIFHLVNDSRQFFSTVDGSNVTCLDEGTDYNATAVRSVSSQCVCKSGWYGDHCSIPEIAFYSSASRYIRNVTVRQRHGAARRVINALAFNMEFDLLEARIHELADVVDVFVIHESNYTLFGDPKPLRLLQKLMDGYLADYQHKIYYLFSGTFPSKGLEDGWFAERHERSFIGRESMKHIFNVRPDDVFIYTDADEIPTRDALLFIKLHDGYPEPFGFRLRWSVFGFFWQGADSTSIYAGCTAGMFRYVFEHEVQDLRAASYTEKHADVLSAYIRSTGAKLYSWLLGDYGLAPAGWHCSWCLRREGIRIKLISAINADFPRWGSYPEKLNLTYIDSLIDTGTWFDDTSKVGQLTTKDEDAYFAPRFFLDNWEKYKYLLNKSDAV